MRRNTYKVPRPCHNCKGTGEGRCLVVCHICNGDRVRTFELFASDLEGVILTIYVRAPIDPTDPSNRVAPPMMEAGKRPFFHSSHAHEAGLEMMAKGEIVAFTVKGWDDFAKLAPKDLGRAYDECSQLDERNATARRASEDCPWEKEEESWSALKRLRMIEADPVTGALRLTEKGTARLNDAMLDVNQDPSAMWVQQMTKLVDRAKPMPILDPEDMAQDRALKALEKSHQAAQL